MTPMLFDLPPQKRGDAIYVTVSNVLDSDGVAVVLSNYTLRAVLKYVTDTDVNDTSAISIVTSSSGITVSGNSAAVRFPASATNAVTGPCTLKYEVQATKGSDPDEVRTLVCGQIPIEQDFVRTSP
jgi:hypothetical protein